MIDTMQKKSSVTYQEKLDKMVATQLKSISATSELVINDVATGVEIPLTGY
jgi:hypothetical protein